MIFEITGSRYNFKTAELAFESFSVEFDDCAYNTRFECVEACFMCGYKECIMRGLEFEKMEIYR